VLYSAVVTHRVPRLAKPKRTSKPSVLLVDDHRGVLESVSSLLSGDFHVAGLATGGRQALDMARALDPDLIVLDINMPDLDGFQTIRALDEAGSRAPVVFLSMVDADDHVGEAFRSGGRGYVVKSRIAHDLPSALDHALDGRMFAPSLGSLLHLNHARGHAMQLHGDATSFLDSLAAFFDLALRRGDATCVIATEHVREGLAARMGTHERLLVIDAADALKRFMRNGMPDSDCLAEIAVELDRYRVASAGSAARLTIFGNMVMLLHAEGNTDGLIALEHLWSMVTRGLPFLTICGYATPCLHDAVPVYSRACAEHGIVSHTADLNVY